MLLNSLLSLSTKPKVANESDISTSGHYNNLVSSLFDKLSTQDMDYKGAINILSSEKFSSNPEAINKLSSMTGEYGNFVSLLSSLAKKSTDTIKTLENGQ